MAAIFHENEKAPEEPIRVETWLVVDNDQRLGSSDGQNIWIDAGGIIHAPGPASEFLPFGDAAKGLQAPNDGCDHPYHALGSICGKQGDEVIYPRPRIVPFLWRDRADRHNTSLQSVRRHLGVENARHELDR